MLDVRCWILDVRCCILYVSAEGSFSQSSSAGLIKHFNSLKMDENPKTDLFGTSRCRIDHVRPGNGGDCPAASKGARAREPLDEFN
jgi:hypothetical protein